MKTLSTVNATCAHCGTDFRPQRNEAFCCKGCEYVSGLLRSSGLDYFYELKGNTVLPPLGSRVFSEQSCAWLGEALAKVESNSDKRILSLKLNMQGISCVGCVWLIDSIYREETGAIDIRIDSTQGRATLLWERGCFDAQAFAQKAARMGYQFSLLEKEETSTKPKSLTVKLGVCGFFLMNTMLFTLPSYLGMDEGFMLAPLFMLLAAFFASLSFLVGGSYFFKRALGAIKHRQLHIDLPISLGLIAAYTGSVFGWAAGQAGLLYFDFVATFTFLMLVGRWLQELVVRSTQSQMRREEVGPGTVTLIGGAEDGQKVAAQSVVKDNEFSISPGDTVPVASRLLENSATLSLEWINGEADPHVFHHQEILPAGALNIGLTAICMRAEEGWEDSQLAKLLQRSAGVFKNKRQEHFLGGYIVTILTLAIAGAFYWWLQNQPWTAIQVAISVLVVSCPCALGVALPLADELAASALRRVGLFIKSADIWGRIRQVRWIVFDKTGTLTLDTPRLVNSEVLNNLPMDCYVPLYILVANNYHPVARSIKQSLITKMPILVSTDTHNASVLESVGLGVSWLDEKGHEWTLGRPDWKVSAEEASDTAQVVLRKNQALKVAFYLREDVRNDAITAFEAFEQAGYKVALLSGDAKQRVHIMARRLGIQQEYARYRCTPEEKKDWLTRHAPGQALMIGDGANDSLAFDAAVCRGTPVTDRALLESSADFFFFGRSLSSIPKLLKIARVRSRTLYWIIAFAVAYNLVAVLISLTGHMHPLAAALLMPLSSLVTLGMTIIGLRFRR